MHTTILPPELPKTYARVTNDKMELRTTQATISVGVPEAITLMDAIAAAAQIPSTAAPPWPRTHARVLGETYELRTTQTNFIIPSGEAHSLMYAIAKAITDAVDNGNEHVMRAVKEAYERNAARAAEAQR